MELDKRFKVFPFCCFSAEKCSKYVGEKGYFSDSIYNFSDIHRCNYGTLGAVLDNTKDPFYANEKEFAFSFFIPERFVKEKKYRPYTFQEFCDKFTVGQPIKFRGKGKVGCERYLILIGFNHERSNEQTVTYVNLGSGGYTLQELFEDYEWQKHYTEDFQPFGVEE